MINQKNRVLGLIGLSAKAGKVECGADAVEECIKRGKAKLVIVSEDAADRTKENFEFLSKQQRVNFVVYANKDELSKAIGKENKVIKKWDLDGKELTGFFLFTTDHFRKNEIKGKENDG